MSTNFITPCEFSLTLPSNASCELFTENQASSYKTHLKRPIIDESGQWEVAPVSLTYPHSFNNLDRDIVVGLICHVGGSQPNAQTHDLSELSKEYMAKFFSVFPTDAQRTWLKDILEHFNTRSNNHKNWSEQPIFMDYFPLPRGFYANIQAILTQIAAGLNRNIQHHLETRLNISPSHALTYYPASREVKMRANGMSCDLFTSDKELFVDMLGLPAENLHNSSLPNRPFYYIEFPVRASNPCSFVHIHSIYVYSNLVPYQLVGDTEAPLFGTVPIQGAREEIQTYVFNPTYYYPLAQTHIDEVEVQLNTENGDPFAFTPTGKVVLRLHFRKKSLSNGGI